jgi:vanillate O-demethylase ferredoxin subunit
MTLAASGIHVFRLEAEDRGILPAFTAGAHIEVLLPGGLARHYSLVNSPAERRFYLIAVQKDPASRGGSRYIHENLRLGDTLEIGTPRNNFPLNEDADDSVMIAGGIGITPILSMIDRLEGLGRSWSLHYAARTRRHAAFLDRLMAMEEKKPGRVFLHFDDENHGKVLDAATIVPQAPAQAHFYACGPLSMLNAFESALARIDPARVHVEYFKARSAPTLDGEFVVELAKSGRTVQIAKGKSILDVLIEAGVAAPYSCGEGFCGTCRTRVLAGIPDHQDTALSPSERAGGGEMMICCSGSLTERLVLDL